MSNDKMKRLRAPNITEEEKAIILYCISKEKHIVECKKTDKFNNKEKNDAWERITLSFNSNQSVNKVSTLLTTDKYDCIVLTFISHYCLIFKIERY